MTKPRKKAPNVLQENCKKLVVTLLKKDQRINWAKEIKIAKQLIAEFPCMTSWNGIPEEKRVYSLAYFLTPEGKKFIERHQTIKDFEFSPISTYTIEDKVYGENKTFPPQKPSSIFEFLGYGKK